jgi:hypothetical protein
MADANPSRLGQINNAGDAKALFLKVFSGEVMTAFEETNVMADKHNVKTISSGKSAQFPILGKIDAEYHVPGTELNGLEVPAAEMTITIDDLLISHAFIANIDEAMNHYETRSEYSTQMGRALARTYDKHTLQLAILAARAAAPINGELGGGSITNAALLSDTTGDTLVKAIYAAAQRFAENDVPEGDRYFAVSPAAFYLLAQKTALYSRDWANNGNYEQAELPPIAGIKIVRTNHAPFGTTVANGSVLAGTDNKYAGVFTNTVGVFFQKAAIGTVKLLDLAMESEYQISRQGTLMVAKYAMGHGILRPVCAIEAKTA